MDLEGEERKAPPFVVTHTSSSLLGDINQPWGYPAWIQQEEQEVLVEQRRQGTSLLASNSWLSQVLSEASLSITPQQLQRRTTVESVSAQDVRLIACLGDSLLTGLCVTAHPDKWKNIALAELPGLCCGSCLQWTISGEHRNNTCITGSADGVVSVGKLFKAFSPDIAGLTRSKTPLFSRGAGFNFARTGSTIYNLDNQIARCIDKLRRPGFMHLEGRWKLLFIWIGANDVFSTSRAAISRDFQHRLVCGLQKLKAVLSKTVVYVLTLPDLSQAVKSNLVPQKTILINQLLTNAVTDYDWNTDEFKVELLVMPSEAINVEEYQRFVSHIDGMHPNFLAQQLFAKFIWNNLWLDHDRRLRTFHETINAPWIKPDDSSVLK